MFRAINIEAIQAGAMAQWSKALAVLPEDQIQYPTSTKLLIFICIPSPVGFYSLFWPEGPTCMRCTDTYADNTLLYHTKEQNKKDGILMYQFLILFPERSEYYSESHCLCLCSILFSYVLLFQFQCFWCYIKVFGQF